MGPFYITEADTRRIHSKQHELEVRTGRRWRVRISEGFCDPRILHIIVDGEQVAHIPLPITKESPVNLVCEELEKEATKPTYRRRIYIN